MKFFIPVLLFQFLYFHTEAQNRYDIIIDEIMVDPSPVVGLPNFEWIEIKNVSTGAINIQNWRIGDENGLSGPFPAFLLLPDSFLIICSNTASTQMAQYGRTISVTSFPSLDNETGILYLRSAFGKTIHAVNYSDKWYQNELKKEGGWSLEMIDIKFPCLEKNNWRASVDPHGGSPGKKNSVTAILNDAEPPKLLRAWASDSVTMNILFNEPVDSFSAATINNYSIDGGMTISSVKAVPPIFNVVQLKFHSSLIPDKIYSITTSNVNDCKGNSVDPSVMIKGGLPSETLNTDLIINEILFNPRANAYDFAELFNRSSKILDASEIFIATRNSTGAISSIKPVSSVSFLIFPGDYIVLTENGDNLSLHYLVKNPDKIFELSLPSYPDDEGNVVLLNMQGSIVDEVRYRDDWHFKLITDREGISLERIDPAGNSHDQKNWHSAASTAGYATPGYINSQHKSINIPNANIEVSPKLFSPDNDGKDDVISIQYSVEQPGFVAQVTIYTASGRLVRHLVNNQTMGIAGYWNWDGLDNRGQQLPVGVYIIVADMFNLEGKRLVIKKPVILARRL